MTNYAPEIEESLLGTCLTDYHAFEDVKQLITPDVFYMKNNRIIYEACLEFEKPDLLLVEEHLREAAQLDVVGEHFLIDLTAKATPRIEEYCQILIEKKIKRDVIESAQQILKNANGDSDPYALVDEFNRLGANLGSESAINQSLTPTQIVERDKDNPKAEKLFFNDSTLDYGIFEASMRRGHYVLTLAESGHGKTQLALFMAELLLKQGYKVAWFQLEGVDSETADRFYQRTKNYDNIFIADQIYEIQAIKREARRLDREHGIDFIVTDYLQEIMMNQRVDNKERVEHCSRELRHLGKELKCVVNPLSQVTIPKGRDGWQREPRDSDVRWSQKPKQDADLIISAFRPSKDESLITKDNISGKQMIKDWDGYKKPYHSVYMKQCKVRHGIQEWKRFPLLHTDEGLKPYTNREEI